MFDVIDVKLHVDLVGLVSRHTRLTRVASTGGGEYAGSCPFCGGKDRFRVQKNSPPDKKPSGPRWMCRGCSRKWGDAIGYVMRHENIGYMEALKWLAKLYHIPELKNEPQDDNRFERQKWVEISMAFVEESERQLWTNDGTNALAYLHRRGLNDDTLKLWRIGFNPIGSSYAPRGIVIPCQDITGLHYIKIRQSQTEPKYKIIKGGQIWPFGFHTYQEVTTAFLFESELDVLLAHQTGLTGVGFASLPAGQKIKQEYIPFLKEIIDVLVCYDNDKPGRHAAEVLCRLPHFHMAPVLLTGKDLTEYHQAGGDVLEYLLAAVGSLNGGAD